MHLQGDGLLGGAHVRVVYSVVVFTDIFNASSHEWPASFYHFHCILAYLHLFYACYFHILHDLSGKLGLLCSLPIYSFYSCIYGLFTALHTLRYIL